MPSEDVFRNPENRDVERQLEQEFTEIAEEVARAMADRIVELVVDNINKKGIANEGTLARSVGFEKVAERTYKVFVDVDYGKFVEYGTDPHMPPWAPINRWVRMKLGVSGSKLKSVTAKVRNKIAEEGTDPQPFWRPAINQAKKEKGLIRKKVEAEIKARN